MAAASSDRAEVDTARPFRSVKEAVAVFGDRILVGRHGHSRQHSSSSSAAAIAATPKANASTTSTIVAAATPSTNHEASSSSRSSSTMTLSPAPMAAESEAEAEITLTPAATVPMMYSAPSSSPPSLASSSPPSPVKPPPCSSERRGGDDDSETAVGAGGGGGGGLVVVMRSSIQKLEADVAEMRQEVARLRKRGNEMEMALASLNAQLYRGLSRLAEMEAAAAARRSIGGDTDVASSSASLALRWGDRLAASSEYLPSFSHALSLGEMDMDDGAAELMGSRRGRRRKAQKVKPIVPLMGDILFNKRKSANKEKGHDDGFYSGDLYGGVPG